MHDKKALEKLKDANERLDKAIDETIESWPETDRCWIDQLSGYEPSKLLMKHRVVNGKD